MNIKVGKLYRATSFARWHSSDRDQKICVGIQKGSIITCIKLQEGPSSKYSDFGADMPRWGRFLCKEGIIYIPKWFYDSQTMLGYFEEVV